MAPSVSRLSAPETILWSRLGPAALFVVVAYTIVSSFPSMWRANAWFEMIGALVGLWTLTGFCLWNARAYDLWLSDDTLILRRGFRSIQIPLSVVTNVEILMESLSADSDRLAALDRPRW